MYLLLTKFKSRVCTPLSLERSGQVLLQMLAAKKQKTKKQVATCLNKLIPTHNKVCTEMQKHTHQRSFYDEIPDCCRQILCVLAVKTGLCCPLLAVKTKNRVGSEALEQALCVQNQRH